jgi:hypothetical protein
MRKIAAPLFCSLSIFISFVIACNNATPISNRMDLVDPNQRGTIHPTATNTSVIDSTEFSVINTASGTYLPLGNFDNVESRILMRFPALPDSVISVKMLLPSHIVMGTGTSFTATVHEVTMPWTESTIVWGGSDFPVEFNLAAIDTQQIFSAVLDTTVFDLDPQALKDSTGVLIQSHGATFVKEFHSRLSFGNTPWLQVVAINNGRNDTTRSLASSSVFLFKRSMQLPQGPLYVGNGEKHASFVQFNLDSIPKIATINHAELIFEVDTLNSVLNADELSASLYFLLADIKSSPLKLDSLATPADTMQFIQRVSISPTAPFISFSMTNVVQLWVLEPTRNYGVALRPDLPERDLLRAALYSRKTNPRRAPQLRIEYTTPPSTPQ